MCKKNWLRGFILILRSERAFTLIELMVVIAILAVLGVIAFAAFRGISNSANDARRRADIDAISKAYETAMIFPLVFIQLY